VADGGRQGNPTWVGGASQAVAWKARVGEEEDGDRAGSIGVTSYGFFYDRTTGFLDVRRTF
jgi:hypothetical protein